MLRRWEELPEFMRTDAVRPYYKALEKKRYSLYLKRLFEMCIRDRSREIDILIIGFICSICGFCADYIDRTWI